MPRTLYQDKVVNTKNVNMIVSAGAGSGKTSTLTDRIIGIIKDGTSINNLLVLTFTNAASNEMKERIRRALVKEKMFDELTYLDSSYICTFDSFALSIVKKYYYVLGIDKHVDICEASFIKAKILELARETLDEEYEKGSELILKLLKDFCVKDDNVLLNAIISINNELDKCVDKEDILNNYQYLYNKDDAIKNPIMESKLDYLKSMYNVLVHDKLSEVIEYLKLLWHESDESIGDCIQDIINNLNSCITYEDIYESINNIKIPRANKNCSEDFKEVRKKYSDVLKKFKSYLVYENFSSFDSDYYQMIDTSSPIIYLTNKLHYKIKEYKEKNKLYTFYDIAMMAIRLLENNKDIREELKYKFKEIMIDEYQDTSDIQEVLISLISNNNVCVVGDIKQSIYKFRNANPSIFKEKYDSYGNDSESVRIDLLDNFRSREEVLEDINFIFDRIMTDRAGKADYKKEHRMVYGNKLYDKYKASQDYHIDVLNYKNLFDKNKKFYSKAELEAFIIANDIKEKIESNYKVFDTKDINTGLRSCKFSDFCILMPSSTNFSLYKKVFEYFKIPLTVFKNESLIDGDEIYTLKNLLMFINSIYNSTFDEKRVETKYQYLSIARSFLIEENDDVSYDVLEKSNIKDTLIYKLSYDIACKLDYISISEFIETVLDTFDFVFKFNKKDGIMKMIIEAEFLINLSNSLSNASLNIDSFIKYLNDVLENNIKIEFAMNDYSSESDSVKMMTVHKSKGLEFQVVYLASNYSKYNERDTSNNFVFDKDLGFISPIIKNGLYNTFAKKLYKHFSILEERSEKIRLFYVEMTRAKEKLILVDYIEDDKLKDGFNSDFDILSMTSFSKLMSGVYSSMFDKIKNCDNITLTKDYLYNKKANSLSENSKIKMIEFNIDKGNLEEDVHFSKRDYKLIDKDTSIRMDFGNKIHEIMESINLKDLNNIEYINSLDIENYYKNKIIKFLKNPILKDINKASIYKEYKFYENNSLGIIDLMIEYDDHIDIIDYKLKGIDDEAYRKQLSLYKKHIENKTNKLVNTYLYSIIDESLLKLV